MTRINQSKLASAIGNYLTRKYQIAEVTERQMNAILKAAKDICEAMAVPFRPAVPAMGVDAWLQCDETGLSSIYMVSVLSGGQYCHRAELHWPRDSADFGRCVGLLKAVPKYRNQLPWLANTCHQWEGLVKLWPGLEQLYEARHDGSNQWQLNQMIQVAILPPIPFYLG